MVIPEYLLNFVKRDDFITGGVLTFSGDVGQQRVTKDYVANYLFTMPPLNEQQRILNAVHNVNSLIESIEKSKDNLIRDIDKTKSKFSTLQSVANLFRKTQMMSPLQFFSNAYEPKKKS